ncbi:MAG: hypothetical protein ACPG4X_20410 [Pikeienuella sp.]
MSLLSFLPVIASVIGGVVQSRAADKATSAQVGAAQDGMDFQRENSELARDAILGSSRGAADALRGGRDRQINVLNRGYDRQKDALRPDLQAGRRAQNVQNYLNGIGPKPGFYDGMRETDAYQFRLNEGLDAVTESAAARGGLFSGATLRGLQDRGAGLADQFENNYYSRIAGQAAQGAQARNVLASYAGQNAANVSNVVGSTAGGIANIRNNRGTSIANAYMGLGSNLANGAAAIGNAQSAGAIARGNAWSDMTNNALSGWMYGQQSGAFGGDKAGAKAGSWF